MTGRFERRFSCDAEAASADSAVGPAKSHLANAGAVLLSIALLVLLVSGCHLGSFGFVHKSNVEPFTFQVASGDDSFHIVGYLARASEPGRRPALLVLNAANESAKKCVRGSDEFTAMGIQVACISIPGYGGSSGPSRFVGPQSVAAARHALDLLAARPDVDPGRLAVWGLADGAVAAGLLMDCDRRLRAVILQSGAYDTLSLWPEAPLGTKLSILRQVWPSKQALKERSVIGNLPKHLDLNVLILHGERDRNMPVKQARQLAQALAARGAHVKTYYFPTAPHELGRRVDGPLKDFLRDTLLAGEPNPAS